MRNLKRALSLTLASVMLLGMMVVGSSAAAGYDDVAETDNVEAIEVLQAIEVMVGDERGFGPERPVNRAEMAVVMGKLLSLDYNYYSATCPFDDVYDWARGWVGACYANKILSGRSETVYDPGSTVTAVEAALMLMRALGYFQYANDIADGWEVATVRQGTKIGIFNGVGSSATTPMTRNQVAQMVLNALQIGVVEPDGNTINLTTPDGTVYTGKVNYVNVTSAKPFAHAISWTQATSVGSQNDGWIVELGERLYDGKLELRDDSLDVFGRPARTWVYEGSEIGTYAKKELMIKDYTAKVSGRDLYELLGQSVIRDHDLDSYLDGADNGVSKNELVRSNTAAVNDSARGVLTEIYQDDENDRITIVSINTYLAKANSDYNAESETVSLTVYNSHSGISKLVDLEDVDGIEDIKRDDWMLVKWADGSKNAEEKVVVDVFDVEILEDATVTKFSMNQAEDAGNYSEHGDRITSIVTDGNEYKNNVNAYWKADTLNDYNKDMLVDKTYDIFLDQYGNFIGAQLHTGKDQYVFITGYDRPESSIAVSTATANAIFTDGTMKNIKVNVKDTNDNISRAADPFYTRWGNPGENHEEMWYSYTVRNDVYTLTPAERYTYQENAGPNDAVVDTSNVRLVPTVDSVEKNSVTTTLKFADDKVGGNGYSYGEDESAYITVKMGDVDRDGDYQGIDEVNGIYTGIQDVKLVYGQNDWVHAVYDEDNFIIAAIVLGEAEGIVDNYAYILGKTDSERYENGVHFWTFEAIIGGEKKTMTVEDRFGNTVTSLKKDTIQELVLNAEGNVVTIRDLPNSRDNTYVPASGTNIHPEQERSIPNPNTPNVENDKIYTNFDYLNAGESQDHADYNAYLMDIGGVYTGALDRYGAAAIGTMTGTYGKYVDLAISGRTLHYNKSLNDMGLLFAKDAPAFVSQSVNGERDVYTYGSVSEAFGHLQDADFDTTTNSSTGEMKQFSGIVAAVLDSKGVAQWVFFYDNTPINSKGGNFDGFQGRGVHVTAGETVTEVNRLLAAGNDVTVDGSWMPDDAILAGIRPLRIPAGRTLYINGDFDTTTASWGALGTVTTTNCAAGSNIVVNGTFTGNQATARAIPYNLTANDIVLIGTAGGTATYTLGGTIKTTVGGIDITAAGNDTVNLTGNVNCAGAITGNSGSNAKTFNISGHVEVASVDISTGTIIVTSVSSLIVTGTVTGNIVVGGGTSATNGYVNIGGAITGNYTNQNVGQAASKTPVINSVSGTYIAGANTKTIVTGSWNPANATLNAGSTIEFQGAGKATGNAAGLFKNAAGVNVDTTGKAITVPAGETNLPTITSGTASNPVEVAGDNTPKYSIGEITYDTTDLTAPKMKVEVVAAPGVTPADNGAYVVVTLTSDATKTKAVGITAASFTNSKQVVEVALTTSSGVNITLAPGTFNFTVKLSTAAADGTDIGTAKSTSYVHGETFTVTYDSTNDKVEFYESNLAGAAKLSASKTFAKDTVIYVKKVADFDDDYVFADGVTAVSGQTGWFKFTLTKNVTGVAGGGLVIAKVAVTITDKTTKVGVYTDAACQTAVADGAKYAPGTTLYAKAKDDNALKTSVTSDAISDYTVSNSIASFKIQKAITDPDTLFVVAE